MAAYDVIVLGLGGMGTAATYHLARRGLRVLGLEQFDVPNAMGSSHGVTRIIRLAYAENPAYVPILLRAYELWRELEAVEGERLLHITGCLDIGKEGSPIFEGSRLSCELHHLRHEVLDSREISQRYPGYRLPPSARAVFQPDGGFLMAERSVIAHVNAALKCGADLRAREPIVEWKPESNGVRVRTTRGAYEAAKLVVTAGAWTLKVVPALTAFAIPERQVLAWFQPRRPDLFHPSCFPVFNLEVDEGRYYGLPIYSVPGFKVGRYHHLGQLVDPDTMDREPHLEDEQVLRSFTEKYFPDAAGPTMAMTTCLFTNSPDEHFLIDFHPYYRHVAIAAGFSGHGFKFCSVIGEILADLVANGETPHAIDQFRLNRFDPSSPASV
jgi:sarcosine oxidase